MKKKVILVCIWIFLLPFIYSFGTLIGPTGIACGDCSGIFLNLSGTNANQNINISPYNLTASYFYGSGAFLTNLNVSGNFTGLINSSDILNEYWVNESGDTMTGNLIVNANVTASVGTFIGDFNKSELLGYGNVRLGSYSGSTGWGTITLETHFGGDNSVWVIDNGGAGIRIYETTPGAYQYARFRITNTTIILGEAYYDRRIDLDVTGDTIMRGNLSVNNSDLIVNPNLGRVGIGTTSPTHKLNVVGDLNVTGTIINDAIYCESSDLNDQTFAVAGVRYRLNISNIDEGNGIGMSTGNNGTNITIETSGVYHLVAQPQVKAGAGGAGDFHMWIEKFSSGVWADISDSNIELKLSSLEEDVIVLATTLKLNQGEKLRLVASVSDIKILLHAQSPVGEPIIPSIIFTMYRIGS